MHLHHLLRREGRRFVRSMRDGVREGHGHDRDTWGREGRDRDGWGHEGHRHTRHGGRRGRIFDHGDLRLVLLQLIAEKPRHGYEIIKAIEERLGGAYSPSPGVIYPTLTMLEELGQATVVEQDGKKLYAITPAGEAVLRENVVTVEAIQARIAEVAATSAETPPASVIRATENLKLALRLKLRGGALTEAQAKAVAAALDAAAAAVEQA
jgi:DNA-binding PadR family transcriptional regulator